MDTRNQDNRSFYISGRDAIREADRDADRVMGEFLGHLPTSDVGARPPWRVDPFMGTWPRPRRDEAEAQKRARMTESELVVYDYQKAEERARVFGSGDQYVPWLFPPLGSTQGTATPRATGAQARPSRSVNAVPIRHPGDGAGRGTAVSIPRKSAPSRRRFSRAMPIVRLDGGAIFMPTKLETIPEHP